jgi:anti-sigma factor RsiW
MMAPDAHDPSMIECQSAARTLYDYLDGRLDAVMSARIDHHIATCTACAEHFAFARRVLALLPVAVPLPEPSSPLHARVTSALTAAGLLTPGA